jgi:hypothetical protein
MSTRTPALPTFLPHPGEKLRAIFPLGHTALMDVLGLGLAYLKGIHPTTQPKSNPDMVVSAHILSLFLNDPLVKAILPAPPLASPPKTSRPSTAKLWL